MTELDDIQIAELERLRQAVAEQEPKMAAAIREYNQACRAAYETLRDAVVDYEEAASELGNLHDDIGSKMSRYSMRFPNRWWNSKEGRAYQNWQNAWNEASYPPLVIGLEPAKQLKAPEPSLSSAVAALPLRPGDVAKPAPPKPPRPIDRKTAASVAKAWKRIDAWLTENAPSLMANMGAGATLESIEKAEAALGMELPDDVRASYAIHDGSGRRFLFPSGYYLSLDEMVDRYGKWKYLVEEDGGFDDEDSEPKGPIQKVHYHLKWIPLTHDGGGDHTLIDLAPAEGGKVGQLIEFSHETGPDVVAAPGLAAYLSTIADRLESGAGPADEEGRHIDWQKGRDVTPSAVSPAPLKSAPEESAVEKAAKRYFVFTEGASSKFWEISHEGSEMTTRYGKIGAKGQLSTKSYDSPEKAAAETAKIIARKIKEGYVEKTP
jgi:cell wall assembly regulator SMI1/predicted DNA-binding WGR domain protein/uncharacterized protein YukE